MSNQAAPAAGQEELPPGKKQEIISEYERRRKRRLISFFPFLGLAVLAIIARLSPEASGLSFSFWGPAAYIAMLLLIFYRVVDWRCPNCNAFLGLDSRPCFCQKCGFRFIEE